MTSAIPALAAANLPSRFWPASLRLDFERRGSVTKITRNRHQGPLRVLKPFYPEDDVCHTYLLHPPGGLVVGDELSIMINAQPGAQALITTPSAGKIYNTGSAVEKQKQSVELKLKSATCVEWLPQETLVFNGANAVLNTAAHLCANSQLALWDIICLGRPASGLFFNTGRCVQNISIYRDGKPLLIERNVIEADSPLLTAPWGLHDNNSMGTLVFTVATSRDQREQLLQTLKEKFDDTHRWGITQKQSLCIARYLGNSASVCRQGFETIWQELRPILCQRTACTPRIWLT